MVMFYILIGTVLKLRNIRSSFNHFLIWLVQGSQSYVFILSTFARLDKFPNGEILTNVVVAFKLVFVNLNVGDITSHE